DIIARLGSQDFPRVRLGVGEKPNPEYDLADCVLGRLSGDDRKAFEGRLEDVTNAVELILAGKLPEAQNRYNHSPGKEKIKPRGSWAPWARGAFFAGPKAAPLRVLR